jgi:hypothetical protein
VNGYTHLPVGAQGTKTWNKSDTDVDAEHRMMQGGMHAQLMLVFVTVLLTLEGMMRN